MTTVIAKGQRVRRLFLGTFFILFSAFGNVLAQSRDFPVTFRHTGKNELAGDSALLPVFEKWRHNDTVKVMHIGDSHVRGTAFPRTLQATLQAHFPCVAFADYGINGAWAKRFCEEDMIDRIAAERPDLVVVSFGTNEAHGSTLDRVAHEETLNLLTRRIGERCPGVCFLFTTPPGSYISQRVRRRASNGKVRTVVTKVVNRNTENVAQSIAAYGKKYRHAVWDIYTIAGGASSACDNWWRAGLMNRDKVHFLPAGYTLLGKLLGEAIYAAYSGMPVWGSGTNVLPTDSLLQNPGLHR